MKITRDEVITRLCSLCGIVAGARFEWKEPMDCFCGESGWHTKASWVKPEDFAFSEDIIIYIEQAVYGELGVYDAKPKTTK